MFYVNTCVRVFLALYLTAVRQGLSLNLELVRSQRGHMLLLSLLPTALGSQAQVRLQLAFYAYAGDLN